MDKNDVKYLFQSTCRKIGEYVLISTGFPKDLPHKGTIGN